MKIQSILLPDGLDLEGWDRMVFFRRMHDAIDGAQLMVRTSAFVGYSTVARLCAAMLSLASPTSNNGMN